MIGGNHQLECINLVLEVAIIQSSGVLELFAATLAVL